MNVENGITCASGVNNASAHDIYSEGVLFGMLELSHQLAAMHSAL